MRPENPNPRAHERPIREHLDPMHRHETMNLTGQRVDWWQLYAGLLAVAVGVADALLIESMIDRFDAVTPFGVYTGLAAVAILVGGMAVATYVSMRLPATKLSMAREEGDRDDR